MIVGKDKVNLSKKTLDDVDRCIAIIGRYGCEATGYPYPDRINKSALGEYLVSRYLKELESRKYSE